MMLISAVLLILAMAQGNVESDRGLLPERLRCEYLVNPLGLDVRRPRLSWELRSPERGQRQTAYQLQVAPSREELAKDADHLWDTGQVLSDATLHIPYEGPALTSGTSYFWRVRVWDRDDRVSPWSPVAYWTTGPLEASDWQAAWIEAPPLGARPQPAHNGYHSAFADKADAEKWVVLDLGEGARFDALRLHPARPYDWQPDSPGFLFPVRFLLEVAEDPSFAKAHIVVDENQADVANPRETVASYTFTMAQARYIRLRVTRLAARGSGEFAFALSQFEALHDGMNIALGVPVRASDSAGGSWSPQSLVDGQPVPSRGAPGERQPAAMLRTSFHVEGLVARAIVYASALGAYELHANGRRVGDQILAPEWTDYHTRVQYQAYDVTDLVHSGENVVGAFLGDGWYAGRIGLANIVPGGTQWAIYGWNPKLLVKLELEYADGRREVVGTDSAWKVTRDGPVRENDILDGESYDARKEMTHWDAPGFDDGDWAPAMVSEEDVLLVAQRNEPIRVVEELRPIALTEPEPGVYVYDLGQNMVGWARMTAQAPAGTEMTLRFGEALDPDGTLYTENLRGARQIDRYIFRGEGEETFEPRFTYHGFRYVEVTGLPNSPKPDALIGRVFNSASPEVGRFECSDPMLTRLARNILWTQRANLMSSPTDCPQRDERLGWMGDIQVFSQTAIFNMDMAGFFTKWLQDVRDAQARDGRYPDFAPHPFGPNERFSGVPAWGDAGVVVPWRAYENYGDVRMLEEHYESAKRWIGYIRSNNPDLLWREGRNNNYNDWLNGDTLILEDYPKEGGAVPPDVFATAFFAHSTYLTAQMAKVLGREQEAARCASLAADIRQAFLEAFVDEVGRIQGDTQAGYALALNFDLLPEALRPEAAQHLVNAIERYDGRLSTGIQSTSRMMLELSRWGYNDVAYALATSHEMPSWGYAIDQGATTIWERWDGYVEGRGFQNPGMNSLNHWALGSVGEWLFSEVAGLHPYIRDESNWEPAYKHFEVRPRPGEGLTWAQADYHSVRGPIHVAWREERDAFALELTVPPNTNARVYLPANSAHSVTESGQPLTEMPSIRVHHKSDGQLILDVASGRYTFTCENPVEEKHPER
jgi:alpha-L-rhamnosidase